MIRLQDILRESSILDTITISDIGRVACKWDTGNTTKASSLHATNMQVDGNQVTWLFNGHTYSAEITGYSEPRGKARRPVITKQITWKDKTVTVPVALTDRSNNTADFLCNMDLMQQLGIQLDTANKRAYSN